MNPTRTTQHLKGGIGPAAFDFFVQKSLHWIYRPVHQEHDFGIDGYIDIVDDGSVSGASIAIQIKCGDSYTSKSTPGGIKYEGDIKHLNYYANLRAPIILVVLDSNGENGKWVEFDLAKTMPGKSSEKWWIEIPNQNNLLDSVKSEWHSIAGPCADFSSELNKQWEQYKTHELCTGLIVAIRKDNVMLCDTKPLFHWQSQLTKSQKMLIEKQGCVEFWLDGWNNDSRELWDIPEVRAFYQKTLDDGFPWLYWLEPDITWRGYQLLYACACKINTEVVDGMVKQETDSEDFVIWMEQNFDNLNQFVETNNLPENLIYKCSMNFKRFINRMHHTD